MNKTHDINNRRMDLIRTLWKGRLTIFIISTIFISFAIFYSYRSTPLWMTAITVSINDNYFLSKETQILLDNISTNTKASNEIELLFNKDNLTKKYIETLKSVNNQTNFINVNNSSLLNADIKKIIVSTIGNDDKYKIYIESENKKIISKLINSYVEYSKEVTNKSIIANLNYILDESKIGESVKLNKLKKKAKVKLNIKIKQVEYNLKIAKETGVINPIPSNNKLSFYFGSKVLSEKLTILKNIKDLSLISPEISYITDNIKSLNKITISNKLDFYKISVVSEQLVSKVNSVKNKLIIIISSIIGLFFGFSLVLIRSEFNK